MLGYETLQDDGNGNDVLDLLRLFAYLVTLTFL